MRLTGKAKEQFEEWFWKSISHQSNTMFTLNYINGDYETVEFYDLPQAMQWGVYQDWADSIGYDLMCYRVSTKDGWHIVFNKITVYIERETRQEARNAVIEKLNQIINEQ